MKRATAILTGRYVRSTFVGSERFVEHLQIGKQIGKLLDMPKGPQAQKHIFCDCGHLKVQKVDLFDYVRNEAMLVLVFYFIFQKMDRFFHFFGEN